MNGVEINRLFKSYADKNVAYYLSCCLVRGEITGLLGRLISENTEAPTASEE